MVKLFRIGCEYDYGQDENVFTTEQGAKDWLRAAIFAVEGDDEAFDFDYLFDNNLIWIEAAYLDPKPGE